MCEKYHTRKCGQMYQAVNRHTHKKYTRPIFQERVWNQITDDGLKPVDRDSLIDTLENAVREYILEYGQPKMHKSRPRKRPSFNGHVRPMPRTLFTPPVRTRGEGNRYE